MTIEEKIVGDVAIVSIRGNLLGNQVTKALREKIYDLISNNTKKVVLDLSKVRWINSTGLGTLMASYTSIINNNGQMKIAHITDRVQNLFMITQLIQVFETYETVDRAVTSFQ